MKLVQLYSNQPELFVPVVFNPGLSAVLAEIRLPENQARDTHNLGKSTLGSLIDFCLLKGKQPSFFLFRHEDRFRTFRFFLELALPHGGYLTIARGISPGVDFLRSDTRVANAASLSKEDWTHHSVPFDRAKSLLDGMLDLEVLRPYPFRKLAGYLIRTQQDYQDVFKLGKFSGKDREWKPFVAHLMGAQSGLVQQLYDKRDEAKKASEDLALLVREWGPDEADPSLFDGLIAQCRRNIEAKQQTLEALNFRDEDQATIAQLVDELDDRIVELNDQLYSLRRLEKRIGDSLGTQRIAFKPDSALKLFQEAGVSFDGQLKKDFDQLIAFNREMTEERRSALASQLADTESRILGLADELTVLNTRRAKSLEYIRETDTLAKYKRTSADLSQLMSRLAQLERQREAAAHLLDLRRNARELRQQVSALQTQVERELDALSRDETSRFAVIRRHFSEIIAATVIGAQATLSMRLNASGGIEFSADFMDPSGIATSADMGTSYRKLECIAFDLAVIRAYLDVAFPRFVYHDGALETLDPRPRGNLMSVLREYAAEGVQPMISLIDSDLPPSAVHSDRTLGPGDVVLTLHDEGPQGRLFRMETW